MRVIQVLPVDERDSSWEQYQPRFRVYLHGAAESVGGSTATYDIIGADLLQVLDWAQRLAGERKTYAIALVSDDKEREREDPGSGRGLVWLVGMDGNDVARDATEQDVQQRMLLRRAYPVGVPAADAMPEVVWLNIGGSFRDQ